MGVRAARIDENKEVSTALFKRIEPLLPRVRPLRQEWRPQVSDKMALNDILFVSHTGIPWEKSRKNGFGRGATCRRRLR